MKMDSIIGDYHSFFKDVVMQLSQLGIEISGKPISHLGYKTETLESYNRLKAALLALSSEHIENEHNGRPILKAVLKTPLQLNGSSKTSLIELMPPKPGRHYDDGLEHLGVVLGSQLPAFIKKHKSIIAEIQDQGPFCQPACVILEDGKRVKFYRHSLMDVVRLEGRKFERL